MFKSARLVLSAAVALLLFSATATPNPYPFLDYLEP